MINEKDNVYVDLNNGHKYALRDIKCGENVIKYGYPIGHAVCDIKKGSHVHSHNLKTNLVGEVSYTYAKTANAKPRKSEKTVMAYERTNGGVGIRNDIWIINTVGCVNKSAQIIAQKSGSFSFCHPYGCSQLGADLQTTQKTLAALAKHPNVGGVLVLGLGCENNNIGVFKNFLGNYDKTRVRFLNCQDCEDEIAEGVKIAEELKKRAQSDRRVSVPLSKLKIGLKCGGSDGYSGITANPLVGAVCDAFTACGASCALTEVPEMFGAETILMERCADRQVFKKTVDMINNFKAYFVRHSRPIYENPSPGNKDGGITTLEEKSLGCIQKGGSAPVTDVIGCGEVITKSGLTLVNGPGNDMVAVTNLAAAEAHIILFTTGRGTPLGAPVPTVKISTNTALFNKKKNWIDFDAGRLLGGESMQTLSDELAELIVSVAEGAQTKSEKNGYREIAVFKEGVTL